MIELMIAALLAQDAPAVRDPCLALRPPPALRTCPQWLDLPRSEEAAVAVNPATLTRSGDTFEIVTRVRFDRDREGVRTVLLSHRHDCRRRTTTTLHMALYDAQGLRLDEQVPTGADAEPEPEPVVDGSPADAAVERYCPR